MQRRDFLKMASIAPFLTPNLALSTPQVRQKYLVLLELKGGNDGLNTVVPYTDKLYYENRPTLHIAADKVLPLNEKLGLNPALTSLHSLYQKNELSIIQNVGYIAPNKSHFASIDIWERASSDKNANGWLYELLQKNPSNRLVDGLVFLGSSGFFAGPQPNFLKMKNINQLIKQSKKLKSSLNLPTNPAQQHLIDSNKRIQKLVNELVKKRINTRSSYRATDNNKLSQQLSQVASLINADINIPVFKVSIGGFDTHANQAQDHQELLTELNQAVAEFSAYLKSKNLWDNTLLLTYSEFGRRVKENGNKGTDHGEASCLFCMGGKAKGGLYGEMPNLKNTHENNLIKSIDLQAVYATLEQDWFAVKNKILTAQSLGFIA